MLVVDASVVATALADDGSDEDHARAALRGRELVAPELIDLEVVPVLRRHRSAGVLDLRRARLALEDLVDLPLERAPHRPLLLTADSGLASAPGLRCRVEVLAWTET